ncbi:hypothetical protein [Terriglobus tenax]|uniref:hypothetical protein n=1 Tax=Terriglobus tenax TaxID=1111115 RepID=UPI0021DF50B0|nr:hypothetical protein [Terriglobus tenax]
MQKAQGNETFAAALATDSPVRIGWKLVAIFYAAVHFVEAYLAKTLNQHVKSHTTRDGYLSREANLRKVRTEYGHLKYYGYNSRYEMDVFTVDDVAEAEKYLVKIKTEILKHL